MSLRKIEQVKAGKVFRIWDLIAYGAILALVAVLFIILFTTGDHSPLTGVRIYVKGEVAFEYEFENAPKTLSESVEVNEDSKGITVTVRAGNDYNVVYIDKSAKTAKMKDANCNGKDCLYFPKMNNNSKFIYCSPHGVKIEPLYRDLDSPDITQ